MFPHNNQRWHHGSIDSDCRWVQDHECTFRGNQRDFGRDVLFVKRISGRAYTCVSLTFICTDSPSALGGGGCVVMLCLIGHSMLVWSAHLCLAVSQNATRHVRTQPPGSLPLNALPRAPPSTSAPRHCVGGAMRSAASASMLSPLKATGTNQPNIWHTSQITTYMCIFNIPIRHPPQRAARPQGHVLPCHFIK